MASIDLRRVQKLKVIPSDLVFRRDHGLGGVFRQDVRDRPGHFLPNFVVGIDPTVRHRGVQA